ncbi:LacI family DNA-binding transcriptional regulator, partial [Streptomyces olivaceus]|uniref:LacI family DNA-binding transcriptional regulator n=1 Tax=Streptomyces olivaceus TaxID=47716 RepID=UPI003664C710
MAVRLPTQNVIDGMAYPARMQEGVEVGARITLAEVATEAGVSPSTVSKVLNGRSDVSSRTPARVERLLTKHGYPRPTPTPPPSPTWSAPVTTCGGGWGAAAEPRALMPTPMSAARIAAASLA